MQPCPPRRRRARPVGDAPIDGPLARADDLAKGWLMALVEQAPLESASEILVAGLVRDGPRLCGAMLRALSSDRELDVIGPGGALEPLVARAGAVAGAQGPEATSLAIDALRAVLWQALRSELRDPEPDQVADLSERLSLVAETVRGAALRHGASEVADERRGVRVREGAGRSGAGEAAHESDAPWVGVVQEEIERAQRSRAALSLLLVELDDADRILAVERQAGASATFGRFAQAVRATLRRRDILAWETESRAWIIARNAGKADAQALGEQVASAVHDAGPWRGAPLAVSVGIAALGEDGVDAAALTATAEEASFAAAARGLRIAERDSWE